jgi:N-acetylmuramoyl-L-alanine amidase
MNGVVISSGHGKYIRGASGILDEVDEARRVVEKVADYLRKLKVGVITFHDDKSQTQDENLHTIVDFHNAQDRALDVSVHFNAYEPTSKPMGTECLFVTQDALADDVSLAISDASGLINRGPKHRSDLFFLNNTDMPSILIEVCFVDSDEDADLYRENFDWIARAIAEQVDRFVTDEDEPDKEEDAEAKPVMVPPFGSQMLSSICEMAMESSVAEYNWQDRGVAPPGYIMGMAVAWAQIVQRFYAGDSAVHEMATADTDDPDNDALSWYADEFADIGLSNSRDGINTLRHLFVLMIGLGMRETSGQHCCGRDQSANNTDADTCEAGLFQTSWNISSCSPEIDKLLEMWSVGLDGECDQCYLPTFAEGVSCSASNWESYGSGAGYNYQNLSKTCPPFHIDVTAIGLRNRRQHWGPLNRREVELLYDADFLLWAIQQVVSPRGRIHERFSKL